MIATGTYGSQLQPSVRLWVAEERCQAPQKCDAHAYALSNSLSEVYISAHLFTSIPFDRVLYVEYAKCLGYVLGRRRSHDLHPFGFCARLCFRVIVTTFLP